MRGRGGSSGYGASASDEAMGDADATPTTGLKSDAVRGFIVTIRGTTPNKAKESFVDAAFLSKILEHTPELQVKDGKCWYVARAEIVLSGKRTPNAAQAGGLEVDDDNAQELGGDIAVVDKNGKTVFDPNKDRLLPKESILTDTSFVVLAVVALDPATAPPDPTKPQDPTKAKPAR